MPLICKHFFFFCHTICKYTRICRYHYINQIWRKSMFRNGKKPDKVSPFSLATKTVCQHPKDGRTQICFFFKQSKYYCVYSCNNTAYVLWYFEVIWKSSAIHTQQNQIVIIFIFEIVSRICRLPGKILFSTSAQRFLSTFQHPKRSKTFTIRLFFLLVFLIVLYLQLLCTFTLLFNFISNIKIFLSV